MATIAADSQAADRLSYEARYEDGTLTVTHVAGSLAPAGQVYELWIIAPDTAPLSLGLLADASLSVTTPAPKGWTLAITLEPAGGAPGGIPSGPVVAAVVIGACALQALIPALAPDPPNRPNQNAGLPP